MRFSALSVLALGAGVLAQRPSDTPICDYYTTALLKNNTAENQYTLLTLVVNTVVIGNYTKPNVGIAVPGILAKGTFNGNAVNLLPYFDGSLASSNRGGMSGVSVNFLDDGGATPLMANKPSNGMDSNQYKLLTHLYEFFGALLGCSMYGMTGFPAYSGFPSMGAVHKFMRLDENQMGYFITQVGLAAASFGVADDDVKAVGMALTKLFDYKCSPPTVVIPAQGAQLQSICQAPSCPLDPMANGTCDAQYPPEPMPSMVMMNATATMTGMGNSSMPSMTSTAMPTAFTGAAAVEKVGMGVLGLAGAVAAALL